MKRILVIDGGAARGIICTAFLKELEIKIGKPLYEIFDLIVGTSVGGIIGGVLSIGKINAQELHALMYKFVYKIFNPNFFWIPFLTSKYNNSNFDSIFTQYIGENLLLSDLLVKFVCTSVNKIDGKTHYFKSWEEKDGKIKLLDAIKRTSAAPYYFKHIRENGNVWLDGGTGNANCPLLEAIIDITKLGWLEDNINILSLGTGYTTNNKSYKDAIKFGSLGDLLCYMYPLEGGLARNQTVSTNLILLNTFSKYYPKFVFNRVDGELDREIYGTDKIKYIDKYQEIGKSWINKININFLKGN
ncbi:MAG: patatin-like phospholipase family protein [Methanothrix sp.]|jgi:hypothetical protein|nr:patatin-like phospholipase family protein [Methanothrix sp.]